MKNYWYSFLITGLLITSSTWSFDQIAAQSQEVVCYDDQYMFDEFDDLVDIALKKNVLKPEIKFDKKSAFQMALIKVSLPILRFYSFSVIKYRVFKSWVASLWSRLFVSNVK